MIQLKTIFSLYFCRSDISEREVFFVFSEEDGVTYVCLRWVVSSLSVVSPLAKF